jgi:hypothetical protein
MELRWLVALLLLPLLGLGAAGCDRKPAASRPKVAVSIFPLYDVTRRIAGDRLDVVLVLPPGRSEHSLGAALGLLFSYHLNVASGATVILTLASGFVSTLLLRRR